MTTLGSKLSALRRARGLSQEQLAEAIGVSRQAVSKWELDAAAPEIDKIKSLADFYGVTTDYLLRTDAEAPPAPTPPSNSAAGQSHPLARRIPHRLRGRPAAAIPRALYFRQRMAVARRRHFADRLLCLRADLLRTAPAHEPHRRANASCGFFCACRSGWFCRCRAWPAYGCWFRFTRGRIGHWFRLPPGLFYTCCFAAW